MTLIQLKYVLALEKYKNFALAAGHCLVAQPTLSLQIKKLEQEFGLELFDRSKTPIESTQGGKEVLAQARCVIREARKLEELFFSQDEKPSGEITLGIIPTIAAYLIPKILPILLRDYPKIQVKFHELPTREILEKIENETIDIGILTTPLEQKNTEEIPLYYEPFVFYLPPQTRINKKTMGFEDLKKRKMILLSEGHCFRGQALKICGESRKSQIESGSFMTLIKLIDQNLGVTLLPKLCDFVDVKRVREFHPPVPAREISLIHKKGFYKKKIFELIKDLIEEQIPETLKIKKGKRVLGIK